MTNLLNRISNWYFSKSALPYWCVLALDCAIVLFSGYLGEYLVHGGDAFIRGFWPMTWGLLISMALYVAAFRTFHTYSGVVRYSSFVDLVKVLQATSTGAALTFAAGALTSLLNIGGVILPDITTIIVVFVMATLLMFLERVIVKGLFDSFRTGANVRKAFIYGNQTGGVALAKYIRNQTPQTYSLAGFVAIEDRNYSQYLMDVRVYRESLGIVDTMKDEGAEAILVSPLYISHFREQHELIDRLIAAGVKILMMPQTEEWDGKSDLNFSNLREVDVEDLLSREKIEVNMDAIGALLKGRRILITGAAGSIGSEMVRQVAVYEPEEMVLIDQAETPLHDVRLMMARDFPQIKAETIVSSITDARHMERVFSMHRPDYVFHAAAYKHVPMMEDNPAQAVRNNINGTRVIADLAVKYGTKKFVMISTDKAVNPTNVMGCSKRICEIYCQSLNKAIVEGKVRGETQFVTTRFGNVLGSNGSVIPIFREQIRKGGPVTVTHPDIIRYFMLIPEACKLVLEAGTMGSGGEIFVFDMGKPVKIVDLARRMIALSGAKEVKIEFSGLRDGEKLYEEVLSDKENTKPTVHPKIMVASVREYDYDMARANEERLLAATDSFDDMEIVRIMKEIVPEYKSQCSKYEALDK